MTKLYIPAPTFEIPQPVGRDVKFFGIKPPTWIHIYDCRLPEEMRFSVQIDNRSLIGSERAEYDLGLISRNCLNDNVASPASIQFYFDSRAEKSADETARVMRDILWKAADLFAHYRMGIRKPGKPGAGGSVYYKPVAVCLNNFGVSVISDKRESVTTNRFDGTEFRKLRQAVEDTFGRKEAA